jgi:hypothetical protein
MAKLWIKLKIHLETGKLALMRHRLRETQDQWAMINNWFSMPQCRNRGFPIDRMPPMSGV